jgi:hypothetical protein
MLYAVTLVPAYGRDYKSKAAVKADWDAGKDFRIATFGPDDGRYTSKSDWYGKHVLIRYKRLTETVIL